MRPSRHRLWYRHRKADTPSGQDRGLLVDRGWQYDLEAWFADVILFRGRLGSLRRKVLDLAQLGESRSLLDVGCGTGTLALQAAARVGPQGRVAGIDLAPRPIARAQAKARRAHAAVPFQVGSIDDLPFADASFDAVTSTLMLHHLPDEVKEAGVAEVCRVLRPGGRMVIADLTGSPSAPPDRRHQRSVHAGLDDVAELVSGADLAWTPVEQMSLGRTHHGFSGIAIGYADKVGMAPPAQRPSSV